MKFKSYYWAIIAAAVVAILAIAVPTFILRGGEEEQPANPHTPEELAQFQSQAIDYTPVIQAYNDLISANPNDAVALAGLGDVYMSQGDYSKAADVYSKAVAAAPEDATNYGRLGEAYYGMGLMDVALRELEKGLAIDNNNQPILLNIGVIYTQTGKKDEARQYWQRAYDINPTNRYGAFAQELLERGTLGGQEIQP